MTENNKFTNLGSLLIYHDNIGKVSLYDASFANTSEEQRQHTVGTISSLAYGNDAAKHPDKLYKKLQQLGHESLSEFIRNGYGDCDINSSLRMNPLAYENNYLYNQSAHKENIACFRIKVPMFVRAQFMRHRSASYLEMSRRYTKGSKIAFEFWYPEETTFNYDFLALTETVKLAGFPVEISSRFLPQTTYTEFYCMFETKGLKNFMNLRLDSHAQTEIRKCAQAMLELLRIHQPVLYNKVLPEHLSTKEDCENN